MASGDEVVAQIDVEFDREVVDPVVGFNVVNEAGIHAYASHSAARLGRRGATSPETGRRSGRRPACS